MVVPVLVVELDEPHTTLREPPREHAVGGEGARVLRVRAVLGEHVLGLVGETHHVRHARLHAEGHLVVGDPRGDLRIGRAGELVLVEVAKPVEQLSAARGRHAGRIAHVEHRIGPRPEPHGLVPRGQESGPPQVAHERLPALVLRDEHHERWQVVAGAAESVVEPRADAGPARDLRAALHERHAGTVVDALGVHRLDEAQAVGDPGGVRQEFRYARPARAVMLEPEGGADERNRALVAGHAGEPLTATHAVGQLLAGPLDEERLLVVEVQLRRATRLEEIDHPLRPRRKVTAAEHAPHRLVAGGRVLGRCRPSEQVRERDSAEAHAERLEPRPSVHRCRRHLVTSPCPITGSHLVRGVLLTASPLCGAHVLRTHAGQPTKRPNHTRTSFRKAVGHSCTSSGPHASRRAPDGGGRRYLASIPPSWRTLSACVCGPMPPRSFSHLIASPRSRRSS